MSVPSTLADLRQALAQAAPWREADPAGRVGFGCERLDADLGGGLARAGLHEICAAAPAGLPAATLAALGLARRAAGGRPMLWIRQEMTGAEVGGVYPPGLAELGIDPRALLLVRVRDAAAVLRAGSEAARCSALGAVLIEPWGTPRQLDLVAGRRLLLAAEAAGVFVLLVRTVAAACGAALSRWLAEPLPSRPRQAGAPGDPAFRLRLLRQRGGRDGGEWSVEWNRDRLCFQTRTEPQGDAGPVPFPHAAPLSRPVAAFPGDGPAAARAAGPARRRAG